MSRPSARSELVLSITLAEIFLLLLLVVWWANAKATTGDEPITLSACAAQLATCQEQLKTAEDARRALIMERDDLRARLEWLRNYAGSPSTKPEDIEKALKQKLEEAKRGHPMCFSGPANRLVDLTIVDGVMTVRVSSHDEVLLKRLRSLGGSELTVGATIFSRTAIAEMLRAVDTYNADSPNKCRMDYGLSYGTDSDYKQARQLFEGSFYLTGGDRNVVRR